MECATLHPRLQLMKVSELMREARSQGVKQDALDEAFDGENVKDAVIELILATKKPASMGPDPMVV